MNLATEWWRRGWRMRLRSRVVVLRLVRQIANETCRHDGGGPRCSACLLATLTCPSTPVASPLGE